MSLADVFNEIQDLNIPAPYTLAETKSRHRGLSWKLYATVWQKLSPCPRENWAHSNYFSAVHPAWLGQLRHQCQFLTNLNDQLKIYDQCSTTAYREKECIYWIPSSRTLSRNLDISRVRTAQISQTIQGRNRSEYCKKIQFAPPWAIVS